MYILQLGARFSLMMAEPVILRDLVPDLELTAPIIVGDNVYIGLILFDYARGEDWK